jgi:fucose permease
MAMTAISLHQAALFAQERALELNRLNLIWAAGALAGPTLGAHSLRVASVRSIYSMIGLFFGLFALWMLVREKDAMRQEPPRTVARRSWSLRQALAMWPLPILLVIFLPTGVEASMGAWTAAYVQRSHQAIATTVTAGSCFWFGLLMSRAASVFLLRKKSAERKLLRTHLLILLAGATTLIAVTATASTLPALFLIGFGLGPIYPLLLATALTYSDATPIFFLAGLGSAFLPWLTGIVSSQAHSLRVGLVVPLVASVAMLLLSLRIVGAGEQQARS